MKNLLFDLMFLLLFYFQLNYLINKNNYEVKINFSFFKVLYFHIDLIYIMFQIKFILQYYKKFSLKLFDLIYIS